jgi:methylphosphonate synthase
VDLGALHDAFAGTAPPEVYEQIINRMVEVYPISRLDLYVRRDDTDEGVVIQTALGSLASSRIFSRADRSGLPSPYYEYRDSAMSSVGPYRPEWIKELRTVSSDDALDPDVAYNSEHLMHQNTFFVGPVNFYWKIDGQSHMKQMNTGDSNYITPFVPHSFASRDSSREAYIIAVTFAGKLDTVHQDLMVLDPKGVEESLLDLSDRLVAFLDNSAFPEVDEVSVLAEALGVNVRDLMPPKRRIRQKL